MSGRLCIFELVEAGVMHELVGQQSYLSSQLRWMERDQ